MLKLGCLNCGKKITVFENVGNTFTVPHEWFGVCSILDFPKPLTGWLDYVSSQAMPILRVQPQ